MSAPPHGYTVPPDNARAPQHAQAPQHPQAPPDDGSVVGVLQHAASYFGIDPRLLASVVNQESGGNPHAVSSAGAQGLGQLMPETAKGLGVSDSFDIRQNLGGSALYLKQLLTRFHNNPILAVAAYNAGPGAIEAYLSGHGALPDETRNYVQSVIGMYEGGH